jgi:hypothetical protein
MKIHLFSIILIVFFLATNTADAYDAQHPDKKIASRTVMGHLIDYSHGDYAHVKVITERGNEHSFFVDDEICFLAINHQEVLIVEYDEVERFFPEGNGYYPANIIQSLSTKTEEKNG